MTVSRSSDLIVIILYQDLLLGSKMKLYFVSLRFIPTVLYLVHSRPSLLKKGLRHCS